jgi:hypothetical protein
VSERRWTHVRASDAPISIEKRRRSAETWAMARTLAPIVTIVLVLVAAPAASAARRYASPTGSATASCAVTDPCRIDTAVNAAAVNDEVIVASGVYELAAALRPVGAIDLHGDRDQSWPRIRASKAKVDVLRFLGGTLAHVSLEAVNPDKQALVMKAGVADGVQVLSSTGDAATVTPTAAGTVLRNSIVRTMDPSGGTAALMIPDASRGSVELRNLTVMAPTGSATGIHCDAKASTASIVNTLVRGRGKDIDAKEGCTAAFSNFRPGFSSGLAPGAGNQSAEPRFADGDYRPAAGSPTIDAGALDAFASSPDPDGRPRVLGAAPDIGAYEYAAAPTGIDGPSTELPDELKGVPLPKQGRSVVVAAERGTIRVRRPGATRFTALDEPGRIPVGSVVDARRGRVQLVSAIAHGRVQEGLFWGSKFKTTQRRSGGGMTTLTLRGGNLAACRRSTADRALAVASRKRKRRPRRSLWARDNGGRFRTHGNDSVATARGTAWLTQDRCRGTFTRVIEGSVSVRDLARHRRVLVKAGHAYLARHR